jgi:hypothetical protein
MNHQKSKVPAPATGTNSPAARFPHTTSAQRKYRLSFRARIFVEHYLSNGFNATQAARTAGYRHPKPDGFRVLHRPRVLALMARRLDSAGVNPDEVVGTLVMIMRENAASDDPAMVFNAILAAAQLCKVFGLDKPGRPLQGTR